MKYVARLLLIVVVAALVGVSMSHVIASGERIEGRSLAGWLLFEMRRAEALQQRAVEINRAMEVKKDVVEDLIAERLTIQEATEAFHQADELIDRSTDGLIAPYRTAETKDDLCHQVIAWTQAELNEDPQQAVKVAQRLEKEWVEQSCDEESAE